MRKKKNPPYKVGDDCYFVNCNNKIRFGSVKDVYEKDGEIYAYCIVDTTDYRFNTIQHEYCADAEKQLKGIKRKISKGAKK